MPAALILLCKLSQASRSSTPITRNDRASLAADVLGGYFYVMAGAFGGYTKDIGLIRFGNICWIPGSLFYFVRPCLALSEGEKKAACSLST